MREYLHDRVIVIATTHEHELTDPAIPEQTAWFRHLGLLRDDRQPTILNMETVQFINSMAIAEIVIAHIRLSREGYRLILCHLQPRVRQSLHTSQLDKVLTIVDSEIEAVQLISTR